MQRIQLKAPSAPVEASTREQILIRSETPSTKAISAKKQQKRTGQIGAKLSVPVLQEIAPLTPPPELHVLAQLPVEPATMEEPPVPPDDELPAPAYFSDKPGGSVVVLGVQLNSDNVVVMTDILVASNTPLNDLALALSSRGVKWKNVSPPIPPGQFRWVEVRLDYSSDNDNSNVIP